MFHDATRQYFYLPELETAAEQERVIAAALIKQMFKDFHHAKILIRKDKTQGVRWGRKITSKTFNDLDPETQDVLMCGKRALEWFKNDPIHYKRARMMTAKATRKAPFPKEKITLQQCCDVLHLNIDNIRDAYLKPSAWRNYCEEENRVRRKFTKTNSGYSQFNFEQAA